VLAVCHKNLCETGQSAQPMYTMKGYEFTLYFSLHLAMHTHHNNWLTKTVYIPKSVKYGLVRKFGVHVDAAIFVYVCGSWNSSWSRLTRSSNTNMFTNEHLYSTVHVSGVKSENKQTLQSGMKHVLPAVHAVCQFKTTQVIHFQLSALKA